MKVIRKILKALSSIIFAFLVVLIVLIVSYVIRISYLTSKGRISDIKINFYTILTQSMWPNIKAGDIIITYKNSDGVYREGDVITFVSSNNSSSGITITHRIAQVYNEDGNMFYQTKGDNNNTADNGRVPSKNVLGKVIVKIPKAGYIQRFLVTKTGWVIVIVLPCMGIIIHDVIKMIRKKGKKNDKNNGNDSKNKKLTLDKNDAIDSSSDSLAKEEERKIIDYDNSAKPSSLDNDK